MNWLELVKEILGSSAGSFAFVLFVLLLMCWVIHKITNFTTIWNMKEKGLDKLESKVDTLSADTTYIKMQLTLLSANTAGGLVQSHSPISLTEKGKDIAEKMDVQTLLANNWDNIYDYIDKNVRSKNAYDIQQFCIETATISLDKLFNDADLSRIKMFAYNEGKPLGYYGGMIGVLIRDKYFQQKGINPSLVDKFAPKVE
jgi:hypothetical protein